MIDCQRNDKRPKAISPNLNSMMIIYDHVPLCNPYNQQDVSPYSHQLRVFKMQLLIFLHPFTMFWKVSKLIFCELWQRLSICRMIWSELIWTEPPASVRSYGVHSAVPLQCGCGAVLSSFVVCLILLVIILTNCIIYLILQLFRRVIYLFKCYVIFDSIC